MYLHLLHLRISINFVPKGNIAVQGIFRKIEYDTASTMSHIIYIVNIMSTLQLCLVLT